MSFRLKKTVSLLMLLVWPAAMLIATVSHDHTHAHGEAECVTADESGHEHDHAGHHHHHHHHGDGHHHHHHHDGEVAEAANHSPCDDRPHEHHDDCETCRFLSLPAVAVVVTVPPSLIEALERIECLEPICLVSGSAAQFHLRGPPAC